MKKNAVKLGCLLLPLTSKKAEFEEKVLHGMKDDEIKSVVLTDKRILDFGLRMFQKHSNEEHRNIYISQKLRELGRLLHVCKKRAIQTLDDMLKTKNWDTLIESVRLVAGYSDASKIFTAPSLALKLRHS